VQASVSSSTVYLFNQQQLATSLFIMETFLANKFILCRKIHAKNILKFKHNGPMDQLGIKIVVLLFNASSNRSEDDYNL
jgi:hypothetical protein